MLAPFAHLPGILKALLVADGTVTSLLSAYFDEAIVVAMQTQGEISTPQDVPGLGLSRGCAAFVREVTLAGSTTQRQYARAFSLLNPGHLDKSMFNALIGEKVGMGEVLRNAGRGSYRRVLSVFPAGQDEVGRTYTVFLDGLPAIIITEWFDTRAFPGLAVG